jgi:hypothetical protein
LLAERYHGAYDYGVADQSCACAGSFYRNSGIGITGIMMLKKHPVSFLLAPMLLTFFILMDITIAVLALLLGVNEMENNATIALIMFILALLSSILQFGLTRSYWKNSFSIPTLQKNL